MPASRILEHSESESVARARALAPLVAERRAAGDQERHLPQPLFETLCEAVTPSNIEMAGQYFLTCDLQIRR